MKRNINKTVLTVFAPVLILTGILGFVTPPSMSLMSGAAPYNIFHIVFGFVGVGCVLSKRQGLIRGFNVGFGAIDLYQALASFVGLFPKAIFQYKTADDILHIVIGALLVGVGLFADKNEAS